MKKLIPQKLKNFYHLFQAILANIWFGFPSRKIKVIGVTGTDGKTTAVQMIGKILEEFGKPACNATHSVAGGVALASTINFKIGSQEKVNATKFTTLSSFKVQEFIAKAVKSECEYLILETSSHSLDQYRVWGIKYDTAVITNVTREHLDYHKTMENYRKTKMLLFKNARVAVVNGDMERAEDFLGFGNEEKYIYTTENKKFSPKADLPMAGKTKIIKADNIDLGLDGSRYQIQDTKYKLHLPGKFNIENALAATCVGLVYGVDLETSAKALEKIKGVPGRLEKVPNDRGLEVIIDYAVTPNALEKLYSLASEAKKAKNLGNIIAVFGSCGERDRGKRPIMGKIVSSYADYVIVTNEDPYGEDPEQIIDEVFSGVKDRVEGKNCWRIVDRREAIKKALQLAKHGDIVVVSGKGAEEIMAVGKERISWNDKKVILEELAEL